MINDDYIDYIEGLADEVDSAKAHRAWLAAGAKGMHVPFHGDFSGVPPSGLSRLTWWVRELRVQRDKMLARIAELEALFSHDAEKAAYGAAGRDDIDCACGECFSCGHQHAYVALRKESEK